MTSPAYGPVRLSKGCSEWNHENAWCAEGGVGSILHGIHLGLGGAHGGAGCGRGRARGAPAPGYMRVWGKRGGGI